MWMHVCIPVDAGGSRVDALPRLVAALQMQAIALERNGIESLLLDMRSAPSKKHGQLLDRQVSPRRSETRYLRASFLGRRESMPALGEWCDPGRCLR